MMITGVEICISPFHPREHVADAVYPYYGHPLYRWVYRLIMRRPAPPTMERGRKIMEDGPIIVIGGRAHCSLRQADAIKRMLARENRDLFSMSHGPCDIPKVFTPR